MRPIPQTLAIAWTLAACAMAASPQITAVRFWSLGDVTRVAIETDSEAQYHAERIDNPERLFLDLTGVRRQTGTRGLQVIPVNDKLVNQIRIALAQPEVIRIVLDLTGAADYSISQLTNPDRIMIELRLPGHGPAMPPARSVTGSHVLKEAVPEPAPEQPKPPPPLKISPASVLEAPAPKPTAPPLPNRARQQAEFGPGAPRIRSCEGRSGRSSARCQAPADTCPGP